MHGQRMPQPEDLAFEAIDELRVVLQLRDGAAWRCRDLLAHMHSGQRLRAALQRLQEWGFTERHCPTGTSATYIPDSQADLIRLTPAGYAIAATIRHWWAEDEEHIEFPLSTGELYGMIAVGTQHSTRQLPTQ